MSDPLREAAQRVVETMTESFHDEVTHTQKVFCKACGELQVVCAGSDCRYGPLRAVLSAPSPSPVATICGHCHLPGSFHEPDGIPYFQHGGTGEDATEWDPMAVYAAPSPVRERWTVDREYGPNDIAIVAVNDNRYVIDGDSDYCIAFMACDRPEHRAFAERVCDAHNATVTLSVYRDAA